MKILLLGMVLFIASCSGRIQPPEEPDQLIEPDQMVSILTEMMVLESNVQQRYQHVSNYYKVMTTTGEACLKRHHVTKKQYEASFRYYVSRQAKLQAIYTRVMDKLSRESAELTAKSVKDLKLPVNATQTDAVVEPTAGQLKLSRPK